MPLVLLCVGHSDKDPGAVANNTTEYKEAKYVVEQASLFLSPYVQVEKVVAGKNLIQKIAFANSKHFDLCVEVHLDSGPASATGATLFFLGGSKIQKAQAQPMLKSYTETVQLNSRGVKSDLDSRHGRLGFVRDIKHPAFLLETGFITNTKDLTQIRQFAGIGVAVMVLNYFNIPMEEQKLDEWMKKALAFAKTIGISQERPLDNVKRVEVMEMLRKFAEAYNLKK